MANQSDSKPGGQALDFSLAETVLDVSMQPEPLDGAGLEQVGDLGSKLVLPIEALLPDDDGSIVFDGADAAVVELEGQAAVTRSGIAEAGSSANGQDVSGMAYAVLDNGVTLYFPEGADFQIG